MATNPKNDASPADEPVPPRREQYLYLRAALEQGWRGKLFRTAARLSRLVSKQEPPAHLPIGAAHMLANSGLFDAAWYTQTYLSGSTSDRDALEHYLLKGHAEPHQPNRLFFSDFYLENNQDVARSGANPVLHYIAHGEREGRRPNPLFDPRWYARNYSDVADDEQSPLRHYLYYGAAELRSTSADFHTLDYLEANHDLKGLIPDPLEHYLRHGRQEGRNLRPPGQTGRGFVQVPGGLTDFESWLEVNPYTSVEDERQLRQRLQENAQQAPKISVIMPTYNSDLALLSEAIDSVRSQIYTNWELCVCDDASPNRAVRQLLERYAALDPRIVWTPSAANGGISLATNRAAAQASGEVLAFLDHDDLLHPHALAELALAFAHGGDVDIVYSDDDKLDMDGRRYDPQFKPDWSPTLLLSFMYMSHVKALRRELFERIGGLRVGFEGSQDYDMMLRAAEHARRVVHIPRILCHWRAVPGSTATAGDAKPAAIARGLRAVEEAVRRRGLRACAIHPDFAAKSAIGLFDLTFPDDGPTVTIVIPTRNRVDLLKVCVESLRRTTYKNYNILIVDNDSDDPKTLAYLQSCGATIVRAASPPEGFSFAHIMNAGVAAASGEFVLLLNNDTEVREPRWLSQMVGYVQMEKVGAVGARLIYDDNRLQHAGITHGLHEGMAGHAFKLIADYDQGYLNLAKVTREVSGVTAACLLTPKALYQSIGGLDETNFRVAYNDVDYCYRLVDAGYSCIQCASAELYHYEGKSRGFIDNPREITAMRRKYCGRADPWYNPNLSLEDEQFHTGRNHVPQPRDEPVRTLFVSHNYNHEGAPNSLFELASGLHATGAVHAMIVSPQDGPLRERYLEAGLQPDVISHPLWHWPTPEEMDARLDRLAQTLHYASVEVVVANTAESFWAVLAARRAGIPCLWIIRESEPWQTYYHALPDHLRAMAYEAFTYPYRVVFVAQSTLEAWRPLDTQRAFTLIRNGLDTAKLIQSCEAVGRDRSRAMIQAPADACVFTCLGTVAERKGQMDLIEAFAALPDALAAQAMVVLVGDRASPYSDAIHDRVSTLDEVRRARVSIVPETKEGRSYLVGSDVFVCSSRVESYPRVTLEAMAAGLPLITTPAWGIREQVRPDYNARLYEPGDIERLAACMTEMILNPELRREFASRSQPVFESLPDFVYMRDSYGALIRQAVGSR